MKRIISFLAMTMCSVVIALASAFTNTMGKGNAAYNNGDYAKALKYYSAAAALPGISSKEKSQANSAIKRAKAKLPIKPPKQQTQQAQQTQPSAHRNERQESTATSQTVQAPRTRQQPSRPLRMPRPGESLASVDLNAGYVHTEPKPEASDPVIKGIEENMIYVEGGTFTMGVKDSGRNGWDPHEVTVSSFFMGSKEITQKEWFKVMGDVANPSRWSGDNLPITNVSHEAVMEFIGKLNEITGREYTLPTEAQWEYTARGGSKQLPTDYSGSTLLDEVGWYEPNGSKRTHDTGTRKPNSLGIYDMSGNVAEWCSDWFEQYPATAETDPKGPAAGMFKVVRGGAWNSPEQECRVYWRDRAKPIVGKQNLGFRLVLNP